MAKVRFLQSAYLLFLDKVVHLNDEETIEDEKIVEYLVKEKLADVLIEEEKAPKPARKTTKSALKKGE